MGMLVLTREVDQTVRIGDDIIITVVRLKAERPGRERQVQLGIKAPPHVTVHRGEVYDRIETERRQEQEKQQ